jgi:cytochrome c oxidase subunit 2
MGNFPIAPPAASNFAQEYDAIFYALTALTIIFSLIVGIAVLYFAIRYREGSKADRSRPVYEDLRLEITWTIIPTILGLVMFYFGARLFVHMRTPPADAQEIYVIGKQWMWHAQHSNGVLENNTIHVPVGKPVKLTMISQDVIHAMYIPAFRNQVHVVPGRYTTMWFTATQEGEYHMFCNMYCGTQHSEMGGKVIALSPEKFATWLANGGDYGTMGTMEQAGQKLYNKLACNNCHGAEDNLRAPTLTGLAGKVRRFSDGTAVLADEGYIRESILRPWNRITAGYGTTMPAYQGQMSEQEVLQLIAYIKTLGAGGSELPVTPNAGSLSGVPASSGRVRDLSVGAIRAQTPRADATPTNRTSPPAVGAIAAQMQGGR